MQVGENACWPRSYQARRKHVPRAANTLAAQGARRMLFLSVVCWRAARRKCKITIFFFQYISTYASFAINLTLNLMTIKIINSQLLPPSSRRTPTPISPQPSGRSTRNLNPTLGNNHPLITRVIGAAPPPSPRSLYAVNSNKSPRDKKHLPPTPTSTTCNHKAD